MRSGPREDFSSRWRTTVSHTPKEMMEVYCEIFFAGFPTPCTPRSADSDQSAGSSATVIFPEKLVREYFRQYGEVSHFHFDETRGVGAVTFTDGDDAERCYLTAHLSLMHSGGSAAVHDAQLAHVRDDRSGGAGRSAAEGVQTVFGAHSALLFLEFAQFLPFVNPLLLDASLSPLSMSRQLLRTFPVCERRQSRHTALWEVFHCKHGALDDHPDLISLPGSGGTLDNDLNVALVGTLNLPQGAAGRHHVLTVMDLWAQYYEHFVVHKTEPDEKRIRNRSHLFASKGSAAQEIGRWCTDASQSRRDADLRRFADDDVLHSAMALICFKLRAENDASVMSLHRSVETRYIARLKRRRSLEHPAEAHEGGVQASNENEQKFHPSTAVRALLELKLPVAATNVIENAKHMYVRPAKHLGPVKAHGGSDNDVVFGAVLRLFDEYATSGSPDSLAMICCSPQEFCGPRGLLSKAPTLSRMLWATFRVPLAVIGALLVGLWSWWWFAVPQW